MKKVENESIKSNSERKKSFRETSNKIIRFMKIITMNNYFNYFITINIILNTVVLALDRYPQP